VRRRAAAPVEEVASRPHRNRARNLAARPFNEDVSETFVLRSPIEASAANVFRRHLRPGALERLTPPWAQVRVIRRKGRIEDGGRVVVEIPTPFGRRRWVAEHRDFVKDRSFRDVQIEGPFRKWEHTHSVTPTGPTACEYEDRVEYTLPFGVLGRVFGGDRVRRDLARAFAYRHATVKADLALHEALGRPSPLRIAISGASGLVGGQLVALLSTAGHDVSRLVRREPRGEDEIRWDPQRGEIDEGELEGVDAVVHLAGAGVADGRWTDTRKAAIRDSRVFGTGLIANTLGSLIHRPSVLVCASAVGFYGDRGEQVLDETAAPGDGFLAEVCQEWEEAAQPARDAGIRVVHLRMGAVLSPAGGALAKMLPPFRAGVGGVLGGGKQRMSWISIDDVLGLVYRAIADDGLDGPVNAVAPKPVTNAEFTRTLGRVLRRPTIFPMPGFAARAAFGEMADALLLAGQRVLPVAALARGHEFRHPTIEEALRHVLGRA